MRTLPYNVLVVIGLLNAGIALVGSSICQSTCTEDQEFTGYHRVYDQDCSRTNSWPGNGNPDSGPGPVQNFTVYASILPADVSWSNITVSWQPPEQGSRHELDGYVVKRTNIFTNTSTCYIYQLSDKENITSQYTHACERCSNTPGPSGDRCAFPSGRTDGLYEIEVLTLPITVYNHLSKTAQVSVTHKDPKNDILGAVGCWLTDLVMIQDPCANTAQLTFQGVPDNLIGEQNVKSYNVTFQRCSQGVGSVVQVIGVSHTWDHHTTHLNGLNSSDVWRMNIRAISNAGCRCGGDVSSCPLSHSFPFAVWNYPSLGCGPLNITTSGPTSEPATPSFHATSDSTASYPTVETTSITSAVSTERVPTLNSLNSGEIAGIVIVVTAVPVLCVLILYIISPKQGYCGYFKREKTLLSPRLVLLYSDDHSLHKTVVKYFSAFLEEECMCQLHVDMSNRENLIFQLDQADKVIIVNSPGVMKKKADFQNDIYHRSANESYNTDMFITAFSYISISNRKRKIMLVEFQYFQTEDTTGNREQTFKIFEDFDSFRCAMYDVKKLPNNLMELTQESNSKTKTKLWEAIKDMKQCTEDNVNWFDEYHEFRFPVENTESGGRDDVSVVPTTVTTTDSLATQLIKNMNDDYDWETRGKPIAYPAEVRINGVTESRYQAETPFDDADSSIDNWSENIKDMNNTYDKITGVVVD